MKLTTELKESMSTKDETMLFFSGVEKTSPNTNFVASLVLSFNGEVRLDGAGERRSFFLIKSSEFSSSAP